MPSNDTYSGNHSLTGDLNIVIHYGIHGDVPIYASMRTTRVRACDEAFENFKRRRVHDACRSLASQSHLSSERRALFTGAFCQHRMGLRPC